MGRIFAVNHGLRLPVFPARAVSSNALLCVPKERSQQSFKVAAIACAEVETSDMVCGHPLKLTQSPTSSFTGPKIDSDAYPIGMGGVSLTGGPTLTVDDIFSSRLAAPSNVRPPSRSRKHRPTYDVPYGRALNVEAAAVSSLSAPMQRSNPLPMEE